MSDIVFILGAGASKAAGAPLMGNFLDVASDLYTCGEVNESKQHFERVFKVIGGLQHVHSKALIDLNNIESVFTALELGATIGRVPGIEREEIRPSIDSLKDLIVQTLHKTMKFEFRGRKIHPARPYGEFASLVHELTKKASPRQSAAILTFNYDIAVDHALYLAGLGPNYRINRAAEKHEVDLLKLHGSLNWASDDTGKVWTIDFRDYLQQYSFPFPEDGMMVGMPIANQIQEYFKRHPSNAAVKKEPVIVPPTWNKSDYHRVLSEVWTAAAEHLSHAQHIFVIGYSLPETDAFFRLLFGLGSVGTQPLRKFMVFNPDNTVDQRFQAMLGPGALARYEYSNLPFSGAIGAIKKQFRFERT